MILWYTNEHTLSALYSLIWYSSINLCVCLLKPLRWKSDLTPTFRLLGWFFTSRACLCLSSRSERTIYSFWLACSVWCCLRICSSLSLCMAFMWRYSKSCVLSWCRSNILWAISICACLLFNSWSWNKTLDATTIPQDADKMLYSEILDLRPPENPKLF